MNLAVDPLFSIPVLVTKEYYNFNEEEYLFLTNQKNKENVDNYISTSTSVLEHAQLKKLNNWIKDIINFYMYEVMKFKDVDCFITESWVNFTHENQRHHMHSHPNSFVSGILFLTDGDAQVNFVRNTEFFNLAPNVKEFTILNSKKWQYPTDKGKLILFPSSLVHEVEPQKTNKTRVTLSFNTWLKGELGDKESSNYLNI